MMEERDRRVVYDSDVGWLCPICGRPAKECVCRPREPAARPRAMVQAAPKPDGIVRVSRDRRNRRGKTVTVITGLPGNEAALTEVSATLKRLCGSGGTVKEGAIEIQGDHREAVAAKLAVMGYRVKLV